MVPHRRMWVPAGLPRPDVVCSLLLHRTGRTHTTRAVAHPIRRSDSGAGAIDHRVAAPTRRHLHVVGMMLVALEESWPPFSSLSP